MGRWCGQAVSTIIGLERELNTLAASATATGIWLSLEAFRQLPLDAQSRCQLLQQLAAQPLPADASLASGPQLQWEAAEATASSLLDALEQGAWGLAVERQNELQSLISALAEGNPALGASLWSRYGELLGALLEIGRAHV